MRDQLLDGLALPAQFRGPGLETAEIIIVPGYANQLTVMLVA